MKRKNAMNKLARRQTAYDNAQFIGGLPKHSGGHTKPGSQNPRKAG